MEASMLDRLKTERQKWAAPIRGAQPRRTPSLLGFDARSRELYDTALPRGVLIPRLDADRERVNYWMSPTALVRNYSDTAGMHLIVARRLDAFLALVTSQAYSDDQLHRDLYRPRPDR
jgi:hypothetical protein